MLLLQVRANFASAIDKALKGAILPCGMSASGHKRTWRLQFAMSALHSIADIAERDRDVRFVPKADILRCNKERHYSITSSAMVRLFSEQTFKNLARPSLEPTTRL
ncbi:MAG: hypothetical protein WBO12_01965 [Xanthobacteraceae bacterium]